MKLRVAPNLRSSSLAGDESSSLLESHTLQPCLRGVSGLPRILAPSALPSDGSSSCLESRTFRLYLRGVSGLPRILAPSTPPSDGSPSLLESRTFRLRAPDFSRTVESAQDRLDHETTLPTMEPLRWLTHFRAPSPFGLFQSWLLRRKENSSLDFRRCYQVCLRYRIFHVHALV
jgi:hypothetical protein